MSGLRRTARIVFPSVSDSLPAADVKVHEVLTIECTETTERPAQSDERRELERFHGLNRQRAICL